jgi:hypothetical protein
MGLGIQESFLKGNRQHMPPRHFVLAIVLFWAATSGWLFHRDLWPKLRPGEPPPFTIDLAAEAQRNMPTTFWDVYRGDRRIGQAETAIRYREADDTFALYSRLSRLQMGPASPVQVDGMTSTYRVTRAGQLREIQVDVSLALILPVRLDVQGQIKGEVRNQSFAPHCTIRVPLLNREKKLDFEPVPVSANGNVLNPLHPVNRVAGLRPGQHWRMPLIDPLRDALAANFGTNVGACFLEAHVLPKTELVRWEEQDWPCLVIEYHGDDGTSARTWVRESDGLVLRQLAIFQDEQLVLQRGDTGPIGQVRPEPRPAKAAPGVLGVRNDNPPEKKPQVP